jgi:hypothetical protein
MFDRARTPGLVLALFSAIRHHLRWVAKNPAQTTGIAG